MRVLACFALGWVLATALGAFVLPSSIWLAAAGTLAGIGLLCLRLPSRRKGRSLWRRRACCILLGAVLGAGWFLAWDGLWYSAAEGAVCDEPQICTLRLIDTPWETKYGGAVYARLSGDRPIKTLVYLQDYDPELSAGDRLTGKFLISLSSDTSEYYDATGTLLIAKQRSDYALVSGEQNPLYFPKRAAQAMKQVIDQCFEGDSRGLVKALLTGDRSDLSDSFSYDLKHTGIYHAVAISGLHVSLLAGLLYRLLGKRRRLAAAVTLPVLILFALMTGAVPSVCRAVIMETVLLLAPVVGRDYDPPTGLCGAVLLLLLPNPLAIRHIGLQLSVASVAGLLLVSDKLEQYFLALSPVAGLCEKGGARGWAAGTLCASLGTSLGALVFATPLLARYFGTVSLVGPLTNLLGLWAVTWTFVLGGIVTVLGLVWLPLAKALAFVPGLGVSWLRGLSGLLSRLPLACLYTDGSWVWVFLAVIYLLLSFYVLSRRRPRRLCRPICCCALVLCVTAAIPVLRFRTSEYDIRILDVGQGQCVLVSSRGVSALVDCGGSEGAGVGALAAGLCRTCGEGSLDLLILTHYDADHTGGVAELLQELPVKTVCLPLLPDKQEQMDEIEQLALQAGAEVCFVSEDTNVVLGLGRLRLMAPETGGGDNCCMSILASFGEMDFLVTGDLDQAAEERLILREGLSDIEVLVAGHHGADTSTGQTLLDAACPETVVISVGKNSYGHPAAQTLDRIARAGAVCRRTDLEGTIEFRR